MRYPKKCYGIEKSESEIGYNILSHAYGICGGQSGFAFLWELVLAPANYHFIDAVTIRDRQFRHAIRHISFSFRHLNISQNRRISEQYSS